MTCFLKKGKGIGEERQMAFKLFFAFITYISLSLICEWQVDKLNLCLNQPRIINHQPRFFFIWNDFFFRASCFANHYAPNAKRRQLEIDTIYVFTKS